MYVWVFHTVACSEIFHKGVGGLLKNVVLHLYRLYRKSHPSVTGQRLKYHHRLPVLTHRWLHDIGTLKLSHSKNLHKHNGRRLTRPIIVLVSRHVRTTSNGRQRCVKTRFPSAGVVCRRRRVRLGNRLPHFGPLCCPSDRRTRRHASVVPVGTFWNQRPIIN